MAFTKRRGREARLHLRLVLSFLLFLPFGQLRSDPLVSPSVRSDSIQTALISYAIERAPDGRLRHEGEVVRVTGVATVGTGVLYENVEKIFIQDGEAGLTLFSRSPLPAVREGDRVEAEGKVQNFAGAVELLVDRLIVLAQGNPPVPLEVAPEELLNRRYTGRLVKTQGRVLRQSPQPRGMNVAITAGDAILTLWLTALQVPKFQKDLFQAGATISVTGIASQYDLEPAAQSGWQILPRYPSDIVLLRAPPLFTKRQVGVAGACAAALVVLVVVWNVALRRRVKRQTLRYLETSKSLAESEQRYRLLFQRNVAGMYRSALDGTILECNEALARILGFTKVEEVVQRKTKDFYFDPSDIQMVTRRLSEHGTASNIESCLRKRDNSRVWVLANATLVVLKEGEEPFIEGTIIDITERKQAQEQLQHRAYHDVLTGLPNRALLTSRLSMDLVRARRHARPLMLMFLDLDRFKQINDTFGHAMGDQVLQGIAERLKASVREEDTVARVGGDEFTILLPEITEARDAPALARKTLEVIARPFQVEGQELSVTASIGIALHPADGEDAETLLQNADIAMYRAKELGRNNYCLSSSSTKAARALARLSLENDLRRGMERGEFVLFYQPQVSLKTGEIVGAEALLRWNHPEHGFVGPNGFINLAEDLMLIVPIGEWVLRSACHQAVAWRNQSRLEITIAVNLSARQLLDRNLISRVEQALAESGLKPSALELEIAESIAMQEGNPTADVLRRLKERQIRISIDDFGTGYSSLTHLKHFPIDTLKIDESFIRDVAKDSNDAAIVSGVIAMAHSLGLKAVAEGVETEDQFRFLCEHQCDAMQGYLFSPPVPADAFGELLKQQRRWPAVV